MAHMLNQLYIWLTHLINFMVHTLNQLYIWSTILIHMSTEYYSLVVIRHYCHCHISTVKLLQQIFILHWSLSEKNLT